MVGNFAQSAAPKYSSSTWLDLLTKKMNVFGKIQTQVSRRGCISFPLCLPFLQDVYWTLHKCINCNGK